jgi:hypothetical protein
LILAKPKSILKDPTVDLPALVEKDTKCTLIVSPVSTLEQWFGIKT